MTTSPGLLPENKNTSADTGLGQKEKEYQWGFLPAQKKSLRQAKPGMTKEWKGETVYMPEAFGIKSGKARTLGR